MILILVVFLVSEALEQVVGFGEECLQERVGVGEGALCFYKGDTVVESFGLSAHVHLFGVEQVYGVEL